MGKRCDLTDLLADQCAHCLGHDTRPGLVVRTGPLVVSRYRGTCAHCGDEYAAGEPIAGTAAGWALAEHTADTLEGR